MSRLKHRYVEAGLSDLCCYPLKEVVADDGLCSAADVFYAEIENNSAAVKFDSLPHHQCVPVSEAKDHYQMAEGFEEASEDSLVPVPIARTDEPLLLIWSSSEWNAYDDLSPDLPPATEQKMRPSPDKNQQLSIPVKHVFERILKDINFQKTFVKDTCEVVDCVPVDLTTDPLGSSVGNSRDLSKEDCWSDDFFSDFLESLMFCKRKDKIKKRIMKKINRNRSLKSFEGRATKKKTRPLRRLAFFYDVPIPMARPSKKLLEALSISDSEIDKRNKQFIRDNSQSQVISAYALDLHTTRGSQDSVTHKEMSDEKFTDPYAGLSLEEEARMALDLGSRLDLVPIFDEETALHGLGETFSRRRNQLMSLHQA